MRTYLGRSFASLRVRDFRLFMIGQTVSLTGMWMQRLAQTWLVLELTGSGLAIGGVIALQFLPILLFSMVGGVTADRFSKRSILLATQVAAALVATTLGLLVALDLVTLGLVYTLAFALGVIDAFDNPVRQSLIAEVVGRDLLANAVGLFSVAMNIARIFGPALAGWLIATAGMTMCFFLNAISYLALFVALLLIRPTPQDGRFDVSSAGGSRTKVIGYVLSKRSLWMPLVAIAVTSIFSYEFDVVFPLLARFEFGGSASEMGAMFAVTGCGAVVGGLLASGTDRGPNRLSFVLAGFAASMMAASLAEEFVWVLAALFVAGATIAAFIVESNAMLHINSGAEFRGRVLGLRAVMFLGTRPLGAPLVGWISETVGARNALRVGGAVAGLVALWLWLSRAPSFRHESQSIAP